MFGEAIKYHFTSFDQRAIHQTRTPFVFLRWYHHTKHVHLSHTRAQHRQRTSHQTQLSSRRDCYSQVFINFWLEQSVLSVICDLASIIVLALIKTKEGPFMHQQADKQPWASAAAAH